MMLGAWCTFMHPGFNLFTKTFQNGGKCMELTLAQRVQGILLFNFNKNPKFSLCFGHFENNFHPNQQKCLSKPKSAQNTRNTLDFLLALKSKFL